MGKFRRASNGDRRNLAKTPGYCFCGKLAFESKRAAKAYAKQRPYLGIANVYVCDNYGMRDKPPYHITSVSHESWNRRQEGK